MWIWSCCQRRQRQARIAKAAAQPNSTAGLVYGGRRPQAGAGFPPRGQAPGYGRFVSNPAYGDRGGYAPPRRDQGQAPPPQGPGNRYQGGGAGGGGQSGYPQGVVYDERSGQFIVNGIPYGHYPYN